MSSILIIEPNQILARQYADHLERTGFIVSTATNAQDAVTSSDKRLPDLVVMELLLPAHSGIEFLYEFRSYPEWQNVPVIILSRLRRSDFPASDKILTRLGVAEYLYKPDMSLKRLTSRIISVLADLVSKRDVIVPADKRV